MFAIVELGPVNSPTTIQMQELPACEENSNLSVIERCPQGPVGPLVFVGSLNGQPAIQYPGSSVQVLPAPGNGNVYSAAPGDLFAGYVYSPGAVVHSVVWTSIGNQPVDLGPGLAYAINEYAEVVGTGPVGPAGSQRATYACTPGILPSCGSGNPLYKTANGWYVYRLDVATGAYGAGITLTGAEQIDCRGNVAATGYLRGAPDVVRNFLIWNQSGSNRSCE